MSVRLLRGDFYDVDAYAISGFEVLAVGDVSDLNLGVLVSGGYAWETSIIGDPRTDTWE